MTLNKVLIGALCALSLGFTACSDDDDDRSQFAGLEEYKGVFVINQGNMGNNIPGSITNIDTKDGEAYQNVFKTVNGRVLGDTPQSAIIHGDKMYVAVYQSNVIEILDSKTLKSIKTIGLSGEGTEPRYFAANGDKVYVSLYDGYVGRIDTKSLELEAKVKVGPNPEEMVIVGKYLYVTNSDGLNYLNKFANGYTVSKINVSSFIEEKKIQVGMNPNHIVSNGNDIFVICTGDYSEANPPTLKRITKDDSVESMFGASYMAINKDLLYIIYAPYADWGKDPIPPTYYVYSISKNKKTQLNLSDIISPVTIAVSPKNGNIFISTYSINNGYSDPCFINEYTSTGAFVKQYNAGIGAGCIFM